MSRRPDRSITLALATLGLATLGLAGCSAFLPRPDADQAPSPAPRPAPAPTPGTAGVPPPPADLAAIPDAVPRAEPRSRFGNPESYVVFGQRYVLLPTAEGHVERGLASWYGPGFHGERTSSGEPYDMYAMTAAHKTLPIPVYARVTNLENGRSVVVRINDRGPFVGGRIIDLSYTAAWKLDMLRNGTAPVEVQVIGPSTDSTPTAQTAAIAPRPAAALPAATAASLPALAPPTDTPAPTVTAFLQAGSFSSRANAQGLVDRLVDAGILPTVIHEGVARERRVFRVRVGPVTSATELQDLTERLRQLGIPDARLAHD